MAQVARPVVPEREVELPCRAGQPRETLTELALEPVPHALIESATHSFRSLDVGRWVDFGQR